MNPNSITAVRVTLDDGVVFDMYPTLLNEDGKIVHIWPEAVITMESLNDIPVLCDRLEDARKRGPVDAGELVAVGWWA